MTQLDKRKDKFYVNNRDFLNEIIKSKEQDKLTNDAVEMIMRIAKKAINNLSYKYEDDRDDGIATAIMKCLMYWRSFNPELSSNPFAYFTQVCKNGYVESFNKSKPMKSSDMISLSNDMIHLL